MPENQAEMISGLDIFSDVPDDDHIYIYGADMEYRILYAIDRFKSGEQVLFVTKGEYEAKRAYESMLSHLPGEERLCLYPREQLYFTQMDSFSREAQVLRLKAARLAQSGQSALICLSVWALSEKRPFPKDAAPIALKLSEEVDRADLAQMLINIGYEREEKCEAAGQFAMRGHVVDIFAGSEKSPARIELFGDEIVSIRLFDPVSQLSFEKVEEYSALPFSDALLTDQERAQALFSLKAEAEKMLQKLPKEKQAEAKENFASYFSMLSEEKEQADRLAFMYSSKEKLSISELFNRPSFILSDITGLMEGYRSMHSSISYDYAILASEGRAFPSQLEAFYQFSETIKLAYRRKTCAMSQLRSTSIGIAYSKEYNASSLEIAEYHNNASAFFSLLPNYISGDYSVCCLYQDPSDLEPLRSLFEAYGYQNSPIGPGKVSFFPGRIEKGLDLARKKILLIPFSSLYKKETKKKAKPQPKPKESFADIKQGDYVVHDLYGIGRYEGVSRLTLDGASRDYFRIAYAKEDVLYIPTEQMGLVEKYVGSTDQAPKLSRLGTQEWSQAKNKARGAAKELAKEYIKMYAERSQMPGYPYSPDTAWQKDFEDRFQYDPTPDQVKCSEEVKQDMQKNLPMDRLLLGDVGYGKTEVALRAAFKAIMEGKQAAVLVPTTILALQHFNTFTERFIGFPIKIEMLSRLRTTKQKEQITRDLRSGIIDIIVGTHTILSDSVKFRDLGLLIVDEEQRFGVAHKDKLKLIKQNVDTLTLSATPIPRTLYMSLIGIKDMSVIETPPQNRLPVQTFVMPFDEVTIKEAVLNELARGGQVFYLHNRVNTIDECAIRILRMAPDAKIRIAHAKMTASELESAVLSFLRHECDILLSTSIIENGVDFVNANTIIIENADNLGLSQLYQLRGRVGRGERQAYAYMTYKKEKSLSEDAYKRLESIREFTKFGSGFKVAMRDLEIRGAGSLLGSRQHGHFSNVGYELYTRMLSEAVAEEFPDIEAFGSKGPEEASCEIDVRVDAYLPEAYIGSELERVEVYKKIASIKDEASRKAVEEELRDCFSELPESAQNLLTIALVRENAMKMGVKKIKQQNTLINMAITEDPDKAVAILKASGQFSPILKNPPGQDPYILLNPGKMSAICALAAIFAD